MSEEVAKLWLMKQAIWQIYSPALKHILRQTFDVKSPNATCQAEFLFLPHHKVTARLWKFYRYALTVVDVASRFKAAEPVTSKEFSEVLKAFQTICERGSLRWPKVLQVDLGHEFMGDVKRADKA